MRFQYLLDKIENAVECNSPFRHIEISDLLKDSDFKEIVYAPEIALQSQRSDETLCDELIDNGYEALRFPGCVADKDVYLQWHKDKAQVHRYNNTACGGFGMAFRLSKARSKVISDLLAFLNDAEFQRALMNRFHIDVETVTYDVGIQKYLDGYEISPHPDVRKKALTFMANINPGAQSELADHHTHYLKFKDGYKYVQTYWEGNPSKDRCWVPWGWCETSKMQSQNNSIVVFSPSNDTLHGVKASYNHLEHQRTQIYGNLWYRESVTVGDGPAWEDFVVGQRTWHPAVK